MPHTSIGVVVKPHGLKGALVALIEPAYQDSVADLERIYIDQMSSHVPYLILESAPLNHGKFKLTLEGVDSSEEVALLKGSAIFADEDVLPEVSQLELGGFEVFVDQDERLGVIDQVIESDVQVLIEVSNDERSWMIPLVDEFIVAVDAENRSLQLKLPEGLLDL